MIWVFAIGMILATFAAQYFHSQAVFFERQARWWCARAMRIDRRNGNTSAFNLEINRIVQ